MVAVATVLGDADDGELRGELAQHADDLTALCCRRLLAGRDVTVP
jgi:hypothetical protein